MPLVDSYLESKLPTSDSTARYLAAALAFVSQLAHLWKLPGAFLVTLLPGFFFLTVAAGQGLLAVSLLFGPGRWAIRLGIVLNLLVISAWFLTRVFSLPMLTGIAHPSLGLLGLTATLVEGLLVILLLKTARSRT